MYPHRPLSFDCTAASLSENARTARVLDRDDQPTFGVRETHLARNTDGQADRSLRLSMQTSRRDGETGGQGQTDDDPKTHELPDERGRRVLAYLLRQSDTLSQLGDPLGAGTKSRWQKRAVPVRERAQVQEVSRRACDAVDQLATLQGDTPSQSPLLFKAPIARQFQRAR